MPRYRVTIHRPAVETIEAENPYMAAAAVVERFGNGTTVTDVRPAAGRPAGRTTTKKSAATSAPAKKRTVSPEARARLAENLKKARAARARKLKAAKKTAKKKTAKKR
ncbi:MAG TPA: hypothetical protein VI259_12155 [Gemmatimonadaceae bacterium]